MLNKLIYKRKNLLLIVIVLFFIELNLTYCKKLVETPPPTDQISEANVFSTDATAISALNDIYIRMSKEGVIQGYNSITLATGLSCDELSLFSGISSGALFDLYCNNLNRNKASGTFYWGPLYNYVFRCNAAIEAFTSSKSEGLSLNVKKQLLGEAQFLRGFFYYYLVNLYGDVPLCLTTDPEVNTSIGRSLKSDVYQQIITDLLAAESNLSNSYPDARLVGITNERVRPTRWAAKAMLARIYLYGGDYLNAGIKSSEVIDNVELYSLLPSLNDVFRKNSKEAIWQLQPVGLYFNTIEAQTMVLPINGPDDNQSPVSLSSYLINSFEFGDLRAKPKNWIDTLRSGTSFYYYPYKYKLKNADSTITAITGSSNMKKYFMVLRLAEQYLIRAEARALKGNINEAKGDLNEIRRRAGLGGTTASDQSSLLVAILHERQTELFTELGQRWFDLKRTGQVDALMNIITPQKSKGNTTWETYQKLYPISSAELGKALNLIQTEGY